MPVEHYSSYDGDDPAGVHNADQVKASCVERVNKSDAFVVITTTKDADGVEATCSMSPGIPHNAMLESMARTLWTIYLNDVFRDGLPSGIMGMIDTVTAIDEAMSSFASAGQDALNDMREAGLL